MITTTTPYNTLTTNISPDASTGLIGGIYSRIFTLGKKQPSITHISSTAPQRDANTTTNHSDNAKAREVSDTITDGSASVMGILTVVDCAEL